MARIIIIANSVRYDGRCLAGIDYDTGEIVRPVPPNGEGIPEWRCVVDGHFLEVRDVVEMDLVRPREIPKYQSENRIIRSWNWKVLFRAKFSTVEQYVDNSTPVLHTVGDRVAPQQLEALDPADWKSIQLVKPSKLSFGHHYYSEKRWVSNFRVGDDYSLKITDPDLTRLLEANKPPEKGSLLTVSMAKPWSHNPQEKPPMCYKVVAAVISPPA